MPANVETMFSVREVPWHKLGIIVEDAPDSVAAIKLAGLDWEVQQAPVTVLGKQVPNMNANVRSDNHEVLGIVTNRYTVVQNQEAFSFTDALIDSGDVRYETAGSLRGGRQVWMLARMKQEYSVLGDKVTPYLCFTSTHDGTGSIRALMTPIRVVCQNTVNLAIKQATRSWSAVHVGNIEDKLKEAQRTLGLAHNYMEGLEVMANELVDIKLSVTQVEELIENVLPFHPNFSARQKQTMEEKRNQLRTMMKADDIKRFQGTGWGFINSITDYVSHFKPARQTSVTRENLFARVVHGDSLLDRAVELVRKAA